MTSGSSKTLKPLRQKDIETGRSLERNEISMWLRSLDQEGGEINRFLPTTLANWIDERMHKL